MALIEDELKITKLKDLFDINLALRYRTAFCLARQGNTVFRIV